MMTKPIYILLCITHFPLESWAMVYDSQEKAEKDAKTFIEQELGETFENYTEAQERMEENECDLERIYLVQKVSELDEPETC